MDHDQSPTVVAGRYRLADRDALALPGSLVYSAHDDVLDRTVLIVDVSGSTHDDGSAVDPSAVLDAARRASLITDQRLVKLLDVGHDDGTDYVATEAPSGMSLADLVAQGPLPGAAARALVAELATALENARTRGVHHQRITPELVFVDKQGPRIYGLGFAAALAGKPEATSEAASHADADDLLRLLSYAVTGSWPSAGEVGAPDLGLPDDPDERSDQDDSATEPAWESELDDLSDSEDVQVSAVGNSRASLETFAAAALAGLADYETPGEVAQALRPWKRSSLTSAVRGPLATFTPQWSVESSLTADAARTGTGVNRQSTKTSTSRLPVAAATAFTPPPAIPPRKSFSSRLLSPGGGTAASSGALLSGQAAAAPLPAADTPIRVASGVALTPSAAALLSPVFLPPSEQTEAPVFPPVHSAVPVTPSAGHTAPGPEASSDHQTALQRRSRLRFNPTAAVLVGTVAAVVIAAVWASHSLTGNLGPTFLVASDRPAASASAIPGAAATADPSAGSSTSSEPPVIAKGVQVDPDGDGNEHPEMAANAYDQDLQTQWMSLTYSSAEFGGYDKRGIGYAITLEKATLVSKVYLTTDNSGGKIQIRDTTASDPTGGKLLAKATFDGDFEISLDTPTTTDHVVIWVTELPKYQAGKYSLRIAEISLS